jgi:hypothetical protein
MYLALFTDNLMRSVFWQLGILQGTGSLLFVTLLVGFAAYLFFSMRGTAGIS